MFWYKVHSKIRIAYKQFTFWVAISQWFSIGERKKLETARYVTECPGGHLGLARYRLSYIKEYQMPSWLFDLQFDIRRNVNTQYPAGNFCLARYWISLIVANTQSPAGYSTDSSIFVEMWIPNTQLVILVWLDIGYIL